MRTIAAPLCRCAPLCLSALFLFASDSAALAQETRETPTADAPQVQADAGPKGRQAPVALNKEGTVLLDAQAKKLIVKSEIVLREGMLEMLLCKRHTKEHESVLAFDGKAYVLHAGLVALGLETGQPVSFTPKYVAPQGAKLKIEVVWEDEKGKTQRQDARKWIRHSINRFFGEPLAELPKGLALPQDSELRYDDVNKELSWYGPMNEAKRDQLLALSKDEAYQKAIRPFFDRSQSRQMDADWVFVGSGFVQDETSGRKIYLAESGDVICVANFPSAMIDVAAKSSADGQETLLYEAWTDRLPPKGTAVRLEISAVAKAPPDQSDDTTTSSSDAKNSDATEADAPLK